MHQIMVTKGDGTIQPLDYDKLQFALRKSGASSSLVREVIEAIEPEFYTNIPTAKIYALAFKELTALRPGAAARFGLKAALAKFGPEGYPFETFIGALLKGRGYSTLLRQTVRGKCISHEIDVIASRGETQGHKATKCIVECKFHNLPHAKCHIQSALYSWARFLDVRDASPDIDSAWLATNTKFSSDVIQYSDCVGLKLLGWSFPSHESIQVRIEENQLYPITVLSGINGRNFSKLHSIGIILVKELASAPNDLLLSSGLQPRETEPLKQEAKKVLSNKG